jgi:hypothetical protein
LHRKTAEHHNFISVIPAQAEIQLDLTMQVRKSKMDSRLRGYDDKSYSRPLKKIRLSDE